MHFVEFGLISGTEDYEMQRAQKASPVGERNPCFLTLRLGKWFEATATGWAVVIIPLVLAVVGLVGAALHHLAPAG